MVAFGVEGPDADTGTAESGDAGDVRSKAAGVAGFGVGGSVDGDSGTGVSGVADNGVSLDGENDWDWAARGCAGGVDSAAAPSPSGGVIRTAATSSSGASSAGAVTRTSAGIGWTDEVAVDGGDGSVSVSVTWISTWSDGVSGGYVASEGVSGSADSGSVPLSPTSIDE